MEYCLLGQFYFLKRMEQIRGGTSCLGLLGVFFCSIYLLTYLLIFIYLFLSIYLYVCMHACMYVCFYVCMLVCVCVCVCVYVCMYAYVWVFNRGNLWLRIGIVVGGAVEN